VLLDNTEDERWGYVSPAQLSWLRSDLKETQARAVFISLHFPVWEPERIAPEFQLKRARRIGCGPSCHLANIGRVFIGVSSFPNH